MNQFLIEYHLYEDLLRLNNNDYFHQTFQVSETIDYFTLIHDRSDYLSKLKTLKTFFFNLKHTNEKNIFVIMKWLVITHKLIKAVRVTELIEQAYTALMQIEVGLLGSQFETYFYHHLVKPYLHYLKKLCLYVCRLHRVNEEFKELQSEHVVQNEEIKLWYIQYNLVVFVINEFHSPIQQFSAFLNQEYPFLMNFLLQITKDLKSCMKRIRKGYALHLITVVNQEEIEKLGEKISNLSGNWNAFELDENMLLQGSITCSKLDQFLSSEEKPGQLCW